MPKHCLCVSRAIVCITPWTRNSRCLCGHYIMRITPISLLPLSATSLPAELTLSASWLTQHRATDRCLKTSRSKHHRRVSDLGVRTVGQLHCHSNWSYMTSVQAEYQGPWSSYFFPISKLFRTFILCCIFFFLVPSLFPPSFFLSPCLCS